ncbi:F-box/kelch-repeat protein At3g27150-like [Andrographis paniculata]|uniref:F-box/kelch-repeat protein At3g27150-like n=1 Tax=Andrographis paniculata TaxID=175694 RepID=UPI0021E7B0D3|nr:F-box/kelch-repeat protein At3g27150-like [Andrographis paniculata]XP_051121053.1 F-box/kelch-repeat protein At3g27150-like [Andrographis paniculata]XP_051121054.1 F-box/kelch-repeat protein At3g27150-like [Andrographis paniculata]
MAEGPIIGDEEEEGSFDQQDLGLDLNLSYSGWPTTTLDISSSPRRIRMSENGARIYPSDCASTEGLSNEGPQDADYSVSSLSYELESLIFARFPRSENWKLCLVNKRCLSLLKSGELYSIRRGIGFTEPSVFMSGAGQSSWWAFDGEFQSCRKLPLLPSDLCFANGDKESLSAGTHLLVSGKEIEGLVIWRYELVKNKWYRGPSMITPRCLFASATGGSCAYVAGGMASGLAGGVFNTAEKYNPDNRSWVPLPRMIKRRYLCAGCYMDDKFYAIGGRNEDGELTCGEFFDERENRWELIPDILKDDPVRSSQSPPLLAVVNNELYSLEASSNQLKVYLKKTNTWKQLGAAPVRADSHRGWGVAFKSLGKQLLVIGASAAAAAADHMSIYTSCPDPNSTELQWRQLDSAGNCLSHFILNCCVMVA